MTNVFYTRLLMCSYGRCGRRYDIGDRTLSDPAAAAIRCEGNFQITSYGRINTPYCEDN